MGDVPVPAEGQVVSHEMTMGEMVAIRSVMWDAVRMLTDDQAETLASNNEELVKALRERWGDSPTDHQIGMMDQYEMLVLQVRHRFNFVENENDSSAEYCIICLKCETFPIDRDSYCPKCKTDRWLHVARI